MTSLLWQTSLQNKQCRALCMLGKTSKCRLSLATYLSFELTSLSKFFMWNMQSLANNIAKFIDCQILANTLILKLK